MQSEHDEFPFRYGAELANEIEIRWQDYWEENGTFDAYNPVGELSLGFERVADLPKFYMLDMFPYPSGVGLHVGHPLGYIGTDVFARYLRMSGHHVLHPFGYDAFGLPAEQYAINTGRHPAETTNENIANMRRQLRRLGLGHDRRRGLATTDPEFYKWTQWIFLQLFDSWYDVDAKRARPIAELIEALERGDQVPPPPGTDESPTGYLSQSPTKRREIVDSYRLAYRSSELVNWCPGLGTVLANEEVTVDGRSDIGNYPVYRRPLTQWMLRITAYADRLLDDLETLEWPEKIKVMQRNWIGRSEGAYATFDAEGYPLTVFTTRPDTIFGASYMVVAPDHPLLSDDRLASEWPADTPAPWKCIADVKLSSEYGSPAEAVAAYRAKIELIDQKSKEVNEKSGVFTGLFATNPVTGDKVPVFTADYVLMSYGTGAIMAVPAHDQRDFEFAQLFDLPIRPVVEPTPEWLAENVDESGAWTSSYSGTGRTINSTRGDRSLDELSGQEARTAATAMLEDIGAGYAAVTYRLRDWLFSRQRYWGEPFPIVYDENDMPIALPKEHLPVLLPEMEVFSPDSSTDDDAADSEPRPPLSRITEWAEVTLDLGDGPKRYRRETNTMPQWAGSCWYPLRYLDPLNDDEFVNADVERYWMGPSDSSTGGVDLYVGGVEHAVLHLLYARFWHKVLFDLGHVSSAEPFRRLYNQGYVQAAAYTDSRGMYVPAAEVENVDDVYTYQGQVVSRLYGKMGKSLKNSVAPDDIYVAYGADTLRLYEMSMGPLDADRPWDDRAIVGVYRFLQRVWRNVVDESSGEVVVDDVEPPAALNLKLQQTIKAVRSDIERLSYNTAIARLIELNTQLTEVSRAAGKSPRKVVETLLLLLSPFAPHIAEELWAKLGHGESLARTPMPEADESVLVTESLRLPVQIDNKVRYHVEVPVDADQQTVQEAALVADTVALERSLKGRSVARVIVVPGRLVNIITK